MTATVEDGPELSTGDDADPVVSLPGVSFRPKALVTGHRDRRIVDVNTPILPPWLRDKLTFTAAVRTWAARTAWVAGRWAMSLLPMLGWLVVYSPRGLGRLTKALSRYLYDWDSAELRHIHAENVESPEYRAAHGVRRANLKARWMVAGTLATLILGPVLAWTFPHVLAAIVGVAVFVWIVKMIPGHGLGEIVVAGVAGAATWWLLPMLLVLLPAPPGWVLVITGVAAVLGLGWHGRPVGKALVVTSTLAAGVVPPLRAPMVVAALCHLGNSKMSFKTEEDSATAIRLLMDVARYGPGYQLDLELPPGVAASYVQGKREEFAAALRREIGCVWPGVGKRHPGHLTLFVSDQPMSQARQEPWPLLRSGEVNLFHPFPAFTDQRGEWVGLTLAYANMIIGAIPRMGKSFALRELLLVAGLDKSTKVYVFDGKGTGDLAPCALYAHCYVRGARVDQPERIERVLTALTGLRRELGRRADIIDSLSHEECPESKVTSDLVTSRPDLDLGLIVVGVDETQAYFGYGDDDDKVHKSIRVELKSGFTELVKLGPALGIIVILATQQVNDKTVPTSISNNAVIRFCLKIEGYEPNDRILGAGAYRAGVDAQMFDFDDKGIGYLKAEGEKTRIVRSVFGLDAVVSERVAVRARAYREAAGLLSGDAAGEISESEPEQVDLVADVRDVMDHPPVPRMHLAQILEGLTLLRPGIWGHLDVDALGSMLRTAGVGTGQTKVDGKNTSGVRRTDLDEAPGEAPDGEAVNE